MSDVEWVALSLTGRIGLKTLRALLAHFGSTQAILEADEAALRKVSGIGKAISAAITQINLAEIEALLARWRTAGVRVLTPDAYPTGLRALDDAPPVLFVRGTLAEMRGVAIVGTRAPSPQALDVARRLSVRLAAQDYTIVSGLAFGIDAAAQQAALESGGVSVAVLGSGVLNVYPPEHRTLAAKVAWTGAVVCEVRPDAQPSASALVARNRIISGLSEMLFVVETDDDGGAMHAARFARAQGRTVYALDSQASGNRALLADGAVAFDSTLSGL